MPAYNYSCTECSFTDEYNTNKSLPAAFHPPEFCPKCGKGKMEKQFSATGISFDVIGGYEYQYGKKNWKRNLSDNEKSKVLAGQQDPY